jgi:hypothetical protein
MNFDAIKRYPQDCLCVSNISGNPIDLYPTRRAVASDRFENINTFLQIDILQTTQTRG